MAVKKATTAKKSAPRSPAKKAKSPESVQKPAARAPKGSAAKQKPAAAAKTKVAPKSKPAPEPKAAPKPKSAGDTKASLPQPRATPVPQKAVPPPKKAARPAAEREEPRTPSPEPEPREEADPVATAKLALGPEAEPREVPATIPWSYGASRVTAAAVDPDRLFVYWEVTDPAIERARSALGNGGPGAWLVLRVYDTSGLLFDGTNAHSYFDHTIDRSTRQWFFHIGKPTSTAIVELGMKSTEGYFAKIVRSGRVEFPRREPAPWGDPEWMTVQPWSGEIADVHRAPAPPPGPGPGPGPGSTRGPDALPLWTVRDPVVIHESVLRHMLEAGWERVEWSEAGGEGWFALEGRVEWESPRVLTSWDAGPFTYPVEIESPRREDWKGPSQAFRVGNVVHVVEGPWRVVIRNLGAHAERELLGTWEIHRSWSVHGGTDLRVGEGRFVVRTGASEQLALGASERHWISGSETRLGGASERWRIGASESAFRGASERLYAGGSQFAYRGASERMYQGASEVRLGGASERAFAGASERAYLGGSERSYAGGSETRLGASDLRFEGGSAPTLPYPAVGSEGKKE